MSLQVFLAAHIPSIVPVERINSIFDCLYICRESSEYEKSDLPKEMETGSLWLRKLTSGETKEGQRRE